MAALNSFDSLDSRISLAFLVVSLHRVIHPLHRHTPCKSLTCCTYNTALFTDHQNSDLPGTQPTHYLTPAQEVYIT